MTIKDIYDYIDSFAPFSAQCDWDNSGLLIGNPDKEIKKIGFALDPDRIAVKDAADKNCDLIITHHPLIFRPLKSIEENNPVTDLIKNDIGIICAHTNLDKSPEGVNYILSEAIGLKNAHRFECESEAQMCFIGDVDGISAEEFASDVSEKLRTSVEFTNGKKIIHRAAVCGGAAGDFIYELEGKADAFISGEFSYHEFLDSVKLGISAIKAGHYETESPVIPYLAERIRNTFKTECVLLKQNSPEDYIGVKNAT